MSVSPAQNQPIQEQGVAFLKKRRWAKTLTTAMVVAVWLAVAGAASLAKADLVVSRDTIDQAGTDGGAPSGFGTGTIAQSALGSSPATGYDWTLDTLRFAAILSTANTPNLGSMLNQDFLIVKVDQLDLANFNINDAKQAYLAGQAYQYADFYLRTAPDNPNYHIPYDTSGTFHLFDLTFGGFNFSLSANEAMYFGVIGLPQGGISGNLGIAAKNTLSHPDMLAISSIYSGYARPVQDFGLNGSYAVTFSGTAVPEPSSLLFLAAATVGIVLTSRGRRDLFTVRRRRPTLCESTSDAATQNRIAQRVAAPVASRKQPSRALPLGILAVVAVVANAKIALGDLVTYYDNTDYGTASSEVFPIRLASNSASSAGFGRVGEGTPFFDQHRLITQTSFIFAVSGGGNANDIQYFRIANSIDPFSYDGHAHIAAGSAGNYSNLNWEEQFNIAGLNIESLGQINSSNVYRATAFFNTPLELNPFETANLLFAGRSLTGTQQSFMLLNNNFFNAQFIDDLGQFKLISPNTKNISDFSFLSGNNNSLMYSASGTAVPEPNGLALLAMTAVILLSRRSKKDFSGHGANASDFFPDFADPMLASRGRRDLFTLRSRRPTLCESTSDAATQNRIAQRVAAPVASRKQPSRALAFGILAVVAIFANAGQALGDLVTFYDNSNPANLSNRVFPSRFDSNSGASAVIGSIGSVSLSRELNEISYIVATPGGNLQDIDFWRLGIITQSPLIYDGTAHNAAGLGGYSIVEHELQRSQADSVQFLGSNTFIGLNFNNQEVPFNANTYRVTFSGLNIPIAPNQPVYPLVVARSANANLVIFTVLSGNAVDDFGYLKAASNSTHLISQFPWGAVNGQHTAGMFSFRGSITSVPEPSALCLLGLASIIPLCFRRHRQLMLAI